MMKPMDRYTTILVVLALLTLMLANPHGRRISSPLSNTPPIADAGPDQTAYAGDMVTLDGSRSYDPDGLVLIGPNIMVNDNSGSQWQTPPSIGTDSIGSVYVVWEDYRTGGFDIYASHMSPDGSAFATNVKVNDDVQPHKQSRPDLAVDSAGIVHVVWEDLRNNNWDIYYANSTDGGISFGKNLLITKTNTTAWQNNPSIDVDSAGIVHVVWEDNREGNWGIYHADSSDGFMRNTKVNADTLPGNQLGAELGIDEDGTIHVAWEGAGDIYYAHSTDGGLSFGPSIRLNDDPGSSTQGKVSMAVAPGGLVHVAWEDTRLGNSDIFYTRSTDDGVTFGENIRINDDLTTEGQATPSVAVSHGGILHITWADSREGGWDIYYTASLDEGRSFLPNQKINDDVLKKYWQTRPSIAAGESGYFHIGWKDSRRKGSGLLYDVYYASGKVSKLLYEWDPGDGTQALNAAVVDHIYMLPGTYTATLTVWDEFGASDNDTAIITVKKKQTQISMYVDIDPDTLNLGSKGRWITAYIELQGADPVSILADSVLLNNTLKPENRTKYGFVSDENSYITDHDADGIQERMFKFDRYEAEEIIPVGDSVVLTITIQLSDGLTLSGSDVIRVIDPL